MAPANKRKIYKTNARGGIGEYGGANVLNTLRQSKAATEIQSMKHNHPVQPPTPPVQPPTPQVPMPMEHHHP